MGSPGIGAGDILDIYRGFERGSGDQAFLYLAMTRKATTGTVFLTYELNQEAPRRFQRVTSDEGPPGHVVPVTRELPIPCRKTGDLLITFEETGNQTTAHVQEWITTPSNAQDAFVCATHGRLEDVSPSDGLNANMVQAAFNAPSQGSIHNYLPGCGRRLPSGEGCFAKGENIPSSHFVEAAINLTKVLRIEEGSDDCPDKSFVSIWAHSRSSLEYTADLKDYVAPQPFVIGVCKVSPKLTTQQHADIAGDMMPATSVPHDTPIFDTATLSGARAPTGTLTFKLYGPSQPTCSGRPIFVSRVTVEGAAGPHHSASFTPTSPGTYRWTVTYSGDANNHPAGPTACDAEPVDVTAAPPEPPPPPPPPPSVAHPSITTSASPATAPYGSPVGDTATLTGGADPTGTLEFRLYGPNDATCSGPPAFVVHQAVHGNGSYPSPTPTPTLSGTYRWVVVYSGDPHNASASTSCGESGETVVVQSPPPIHPTPEEPEQKPARPKPMPKPKPPPPRFTG